MSLLFHLSEVAVLTGVAVTSLGGIVQKIHGIVKCFKNSMEKT